MDKFEAATNLAHFLMEKTGSIFGTIDVRMSAAEQRQLFGHFVGKGTIEINGETETIKHYRKVCFGLDSECTKVLRWRDL